MPQAFPSSVTGGLRRAGRYIAANPVAGLTAPPWRTPLSAWWPLPLFAVVAIPLGFYGQVLRWNPVWPAWAPFLAVALFISPALLEELVFRGLLIPRNLLSHGLNHRLGRITQALAASTLIYTLSHPLGALTTSPAARFLFLDPIFLVIVALLGATCAWTYAVSKSLWVPILIHWLTVLVWVLLLDGYELVLALEGHAWQTG